MREVNVAGLLHRGITTEEERTLLAESLFYYCSGSDPSPVIAFGAEYPLYIYVDSAPDFEGFSAELIRSLQDAGFRLSENERFSGGPRWNITDRISLTAWETAAEERFRVLYLQYDAMEAFKNLFADGHDYVLPRCICNHRYEFMDGDIVRSGEFFGGIVRRTEYVMGYCFSRDHEEVGEYKYCGRYGDESIKLYHKKR